MNLNKQAVQRVLFGMFLFVLACLGVMVYVNWQTLFHTFTPQPDRFTELYFQNNEKILSKPVAILNYNAVPYTFSFTIHNEEGVDKAYTYSVTISGYQNSVIDKQTVFLANNQAKTFSETLILPNKIPTRTKVMINLENKNQQIFFWTGGAQ